MYRVSQGSRDAKVSAPLEEGEKSEIRVIQAGSAQFWHTDHEVHETDGAEGVVDGTIERNRLSMKIYWQNPADSIGVYKGEIAQSGPRPQDGYLVCVHDSLEGPLSPFALIAVTS